MRDVITLGIGSLLGALIATKPAPSSMSLPLPSLFAFWIHLSVGFPQVEMPFKTIGTTLIASLYLEQAFAPNSCSVRFAK